jgi:Ca-activated chloride channel family protein
MHFANPQLLWFLLVIPPAMIAFFWWSWRTRQRLMTQFIQTRLLAALTVGISPTRQKIRLACIVAAVVCFILALARPQLGFDWEEVKQRGLDVIVAIDTSKSMLAEDIAPNRLKRAKLAALDLMQQAKSDRLALIAFAGGAFLQCPLTIDDSAFRQSVDSLDVNVIPQGGTAIAEAIDTASASFREGDNHKALVLFTDGEDQDSGAVEAAKRAGEAGIHIYTIGIGSTQGELLRITDAKGRTDYIRDEQGNVVKSHLNESLLREVAGATPGGFYLPLRGANTMETLYEKGIGTLPKSETSEKLVRRYHERYYWPLAAAMIFLLIEMLFPERRAESKTTTGASAPAKAGLRAAAALLALLALSMSALGSPASALREYKTGKYDNALKDYQQALEKKKDDPRLHFNAGAAAYKSKDFEEAAKQFDEALNSPDLKLLEQSYYNRGNARYYLGDSNPDPSKKTETWEEAVKDFESAMKLNAQDPDAKFNYEFVKKRLEELRQQQQQQKKDDKNDQNKDDQNKDQQQQNKQDQDKKDQSKNDQDKKDQEKKDQQNKQDQKNKDSSQQQKEQQQKEQAQKDKEKQKQSAEQKKKDLEKQEAQKSSGNPEDKDKQEGQQTYAAGQMTPQQAKQLLDAQKGQEMMLPIKPQGKPRDPSKPLRDW